MRLKYAVVSDSGNGIKIPDVCDALWVAHTNLLDLFQPDGAGG